MEGPAARGPQKSLNAVAVTEPNRSQSPRCPCKAPPNFTIPWSGSTAGGMAPVYLSLWRSIGSNAMGKMGKLATPLNYPNGLMPAWAAALAESLKFTAPFFFARLWPRLSDYRRPPTP